MTAITHENNTGNPFGKIFLGSIVLLAIFSIMWICHAVERHGILEVSLVESCLEKKTGTFKFGPRAEFFRDRRVLRMFANWKMGIKQ